jgi:glycosyltransferase involved in cell wall biosynthesis
MNRLPNLLVISQAIPETVYAGSIQLHRLLSDYPAEQLLVIGPTPQPEAKILPCRYETLKLKLERLTRTRFATLVRSLRTLRALPEFSTNSIDALQKGFQPEVVLALMQVQPYYHLAYRYAKAHNLPLVLIVHDIPETFEEVAGWAKKRQIARNVAAYTYATQRLCISPQMADHLEDVYGCPGEILYPSRSEELTPRSSLESKTLKEAGCLTLGYAGTLSYGYGEQLQQMIPVFQQTQTKLRIYSHDLSFPQIPGLVTYCGYAATADDTWRRIKSECDAVILPYAWSEDPTLRNLYQTHFPSKLSEYLALGMPVLVFGPEYATGVQWGLSNPESVLVMTQNQPDQWAQVLDRVQESSDLRASLSQQAVMAGDRDFSPAESRHKFTTYLRQCLMKQ